MNLSQTKGGEKMISHIIWDLGDTLIFGPHDGMDLKPLYDYPEVRLRPKVKETLIQLQTMGYQQAIFSNTARSDSQIVKETMKRLDVDRFFVYIFATQSELEPGKMQKPDQKAFRFVLDQLKIDHTQAIMVGNTWDTDILGANRSGMSAIWLTNPQVSKRSDPQSAQVPPWVFPVWDVEDIPALMKLCSIAGSRRG
jgi:HAD superfamily hydrolase (TIGR01662 family)